MCHLLHLLDLLFLRQVVAAIVIYFPLIQHNISYSEQYQTARDEMAARCSPTTTNVLCSASQNMKYHAGVGAFYCGSLLAPEYVFTLTE